MNKKVQQFKMEFCQFKLTYGGTYINDIFLQNYFAMKKGDIMSNYLRNFLGTLSPIVHRIS